MANLTRRAVLVLILACVAAAPAFGQAEDPARSSLQALIREKLDPAAPKVGFMPDKGIAWLEANKQTLVGIRPSGLGEQPWGMTALRPGAAGKPSLLYLYVFDWHVSGRLIVYGLTGGVGRAYVLSDPKQANLPISWMGSRSVLSVSKEPPDALATVVVLELTDQFATTEVVTRPGDDGRIVLAARDAVVHGKTVRYEPEPHKNTVGYWSDPSDWVSWRLEVKEPGAYAVEILQGCGKGSGGSTVDFAAAGQVLNVTVQDTGGFQNFVSRGIGRFTFEKPGTYTLTVKPVKKPGVAVMDLRSVTLTKTPQG
jgi:hypothetical protein